MFDCIKCLFKNFCAGTKMKYFLFSGDSGGANSRSGSPESSGAKIDRNFTRCIVSVFFVLVSVLTLTVLFSSEASKFLPKTVQEQIGQILDKFGLEPRVHAVVIDAGSTGNFFILSTKFDKSFSN